MCDFLPQCQQCKHKQSCIYRPFDGFCNLMVCLLTFREKQSRSASGVEFYSLINLKNVVLGTKCHQYLRCSFSDFKH